MNLQGNGHHFYGVSQHGAGAYRAMKEIQEQQREHDARKQAAAPVNALNDARKLALWFKAKYGEEAFARFWASIPDDTTAEQDFCFLTAMIDYIAAEGDFDKALARLKDYVHAQEGING